MLVSLYVTCVVWYLAVSGVTMHNNNNNNNRISKGLFYVKEEHYEWLKKNIIEINIFYHVDNINNVYYVSS